MSGRAREVLDRDIEDGVSASKDAEAERWKQEAAEVAQLDEVVQVRTPLCGLQKGVGRCSGKRAVVRNDLSRGRCPLIGTA